MIAALTTAATPWDEAPLRVQASAAAEAAVFLAYGKLSELGAAWDGEPVSVYSMSSICSLPVYCSNSSSSAREAQRAGRSLGRIACQCVNLVPACTAQLDITFAAGGSSVGVVVP